MTTESKKLLTVKMEDGQIGTRFPARGLAGLGELLRVLEHDCLIAHELVPIVRELVGTIEGLQALVKQLMPGVQHIVLQDYRPMNEAPIRGYKAVAAAAPYLED